MNKWNAVKTIVLAQVTAATVALSLLAGNVRAADEMTVSIGYYPGNIFNALQYVADAKGFYKAAGLTATFMNVTTGPLMNQFLSNGTIDFGYHPPSNVGVAREQGLDEVFIVGNVTMIYVMIVRPGINQPNKGKYPASVADLKGLNWGVTGRGADSELIMRAMALDAKLDLDKDVTWIAVGQPSTGLPALKAGRIDVYFTYEPAVLVASTLGIAQPVVDLRKGEGPGDFKGNVYQGIVALRKVAASKPKAVEAIVKAHTMAYCWMNDKKNFDELVGVLKAQLPVKELSDEQFRQMVRDNLPTFTLTFPAAHLQPWNTMLMRSKVLKAPLEINNIMWKSVPASDPKC